MNWSQNMRMKISKALWVEESPFGKADIEASKTIKNQPSFNLRVRILRYEELQSGSKRRHHREISVPYASEIYTHNDSLFKQIAMKNAKSDLSLASRAQMDG